MSEELPLKEVFERFDDALAFFQARTPMPAEQFYALEAQARGKSFTVSNVAQMQMVQQALDSIDRALETGQDLQSWKEEIGPALRAAWGGDVEHPAWRLETIFRTNVQTAFSHGRIRQMREPAVAGLRPFWLFDAIIDGRQTDICDARDGVLLPADDPWWLSNTPPLHFCCRSGIRSLRRSQADRRGGVNPPDGDIDTAGDGFGAAPSLDPRVQVAPFVPDVKGDLALEGARLRKEAEARRAEDERLRREAQRVADIEREARENPFTEEDLRRLPTVTARDFRSLTKAQRDAGKAAARQSLELGERLSAEERAAIAAWSDGYDWTIRRIQRGDADDQELYRLRRAHVIANGKDETEEQSREHVAAAHLHRVFLERALASWRGSSSAPKTVYRGMGGFSGEAIRRLLLTGEINLEGQTTSSSWDPFSAHLFERNFQAPDTYGVVLQLRTRSGMPIEELSEERTEFELLLRGDLRFRIIGARQLLPETPGDAIGTVLIEAEEIG